MTKTEFENILGGDVTPQEYAVIEAVYLDHPLCSNKESTVFFWSRGGIVLFNALLPDAIRVRNATFEMNVAKGKLSNIMQELVCPKTVERFVPLATGNSQLATAPKEAK